MKDKTFIVTHAKARAPLTIKGENLNDALEKEGLNPDVWKEVEEPEKAPEASFGKDN